jgi:hypothetical protein
MLVVALVALTGPFVLALALFPGGLAISTTRPVAVTGAQYDPLRVCAGLGASLMCLATAVVIIRRTDWSVPGAMTPAPGS